MVTLFLVFIITKGALTLYEGNTIEGGAIRGGDTAQYIITNHNTKKKTYPDIIVPVPASHRFAVQIC